MAGREKLSNAVLLSKLKDGTAEFELSHPTNPIQSWRSRLSLFVNGGGSVSPLFARIAGSSPVSGTTRKVEHYTVQKVTGDGRCMFRALVKGMALNKGLSLNPRQERDDADELRMAVKEIICESEDEKHQYEEAIISITVEESLKRYCQRIKRSDFWGGESELLVLSKLCCQPIIVYIPEHEHTTVSRGNRFIPIAEYGAEFGKPKKNKKPRQAVKLLYSGSNHYDLLV